VLGANAHIARAGVDASRSIFTSSHAVIAQLEIPLDMVCTTACGSRGEGVDDQMYAQDEVVAVRMPERLFDLSWIGFRFDLRFCHAEFLPQCGGDDGVRPASTLISAGLRRKDYGIPT
jgi:hypothetical protein